MTIHVIFDLDGTLLDHRTAAKHALKLCALEWWLPNEQIGIEQEIFWFELEEKYMTEFLAGTISFSAQRIARIRDFIAQYRSEDHPLSHLYSQLDLMQAEQLYLQHYEEQWLAYPEVQSVLQQLCETGFSLAIFSNGEKQQQKKKIRRLNLSLSQKIPLITPADIGCAKPEILAFERVLNFLSSSPAHAAYIGDNFTSDAIPSAAAGMHAMWLDRSRQYTNSHRESIPVIHTLSELPGLLKDIFSKDTFS